MKKLFCKLNFLKGGSSIATSPVLEESPDPTFIINYTHYYHVCYDFHVCIIQIIYICDMDNVYVCIVLI